jgi:hypothetical protein
MNIYATKMIDPWKTHGCVMTYYSGGVNVLDPDPATIDLRDIELGLRRIVRWNGMTDRAVTVGEHSVLFARTVPQDLKIHALLHDAAEAYIGDIVRPVKALVTGVIEPIERGLISAIYTKLGLTEPDWDHIHDLENEYFLGELTLNSWADLSLWKRSITQELDLPYPGG